MKSFRMLWIALFFLPALAFACGDSDKDAGPKPTPTASIDLTKDDLGRSVSAPQNASRIVALSPSIVELMYAVGATPIGRPSSATYPEAAKSVPAFGESRTPNVEVLVSMKPDLIIADAVLHKDMMNELSKVGVPVFAVRVASFDDVTHGMRVVGALSGHKEQGETQAKALEDKLAAIKAKLPATGPSVIVLVAAGQGQYIAARPNTYLGDVLSKLGAKNLISTADPENFSYQGFTDYSQERILEKNPDVIITASIGGPPGTPKTSDIIKTYVPAFAGLSAVKNNRVYEVDAFVYIQSAGPRVSQILDELPGILYPSVFASR
ncbi:MAG TPA: ABC transporter substrate-binding protein [Dehalococcoidia bacterium]|nr:ABC transporter substrate-binding protein [Dehalococcoidia bacterium]